MITLLVLLLFFSFSAWTQKGDGAIVKVVGGETVQAGEYPWVVSLVTDNGTQGCGASLIAPQWVLTAGHCSVDFPGFPQNTQVLINALVTDISVLEPFSELIDIEEVFVHEDYSLFGGGPDIALVRLSEPAVTLPVALAEYSDSLLFAHAMPAKVLGWGKTAAGGSNSDSLLLGNTNFVGNFQCGEQYTTGQGGNPFEENPDGLICAGYLEGDEQVVGAAQGDSGGPLFFDDNGQYKQVGIVSFGNSDVTTEDYPGVFTLIPRHREWMEEIMSQYGPTSTTAAHAEELDITYYANDRVEVTNLDQGDRYSVELYDLAGQLKTKTDYGTPGDRLSFSLADFQPGLYVVVISNHGKGLRSAKKVTKF